MSVRLAHLDHQCRTDARVGILRSARASNLALVIDGVIRAATKEHRHSRGLVALPAAAGAPSASVRRSIRELAPYDVVVAQLDCDRVQDSARIADVVDGLVVPAVVILHSISSRPTTEAKGILARIYDSASLIVVMSDSAKHILARNYPVGADKVVVIPWGSSSARGVPMGTRANRGGPHHILTWGEVAPGLGAEHAIDAVAMLHAKGHAVRYTVASTERSDAGGRDRSVYARYLRNRADSAGVGHLVRIAAGTRDALGLRQLVASASLVVLPFDDDEVAVSPSLVESIASGRPVVATTYPHAVELLRDGAGLLVPHRNAVAMAEAIRVATTDQCILDAMTRRSRLLAPSLSWGLATRRFAQACTRLAAPREMLAA